MTTFTISNLRPSLPDQRDIPYRSPFTPGHLIPVIDRRPEILSVPNQGAMGTCVTNGITNQCEHVLNINGEPVELSRMFPYTITKNMQGTMSGSGLVPREAYKAFYRYGTPPESAYPYDPAKEFVLPPDDLYPVAFENRVRRYEAVVRPGGNDGTKEDRIHRIHSALQEGLTVGFAMTVSNSLYDMKGPLESHNYELVNPGNIIGNHFMLIAGSDLQKQTLTVLNSWGEEWGESGYGRFNNSIVEQPFFEAWIVRDIKGFGVPDKPGIKLEFINKFRIEARYTAKPEEVGKKVNIWIGGVINGQGYMRQPAPDNNLDTKAPDVWMPISSGTRPVVTNYELKEDNFLKVVQWMNLSGFSGGDIYVGIGENLASAEIVKICTIPTGL